MDIPPSLEILMPGMLRSSSLEIEQHLLTTWMVDVYATGWT